MMITRDIARTSTWILIRKSRRCMGGRLRNPLKRILILFYSCVLNLIFVNLPNRFQQGK